MNELSLISLRGITGAATQLESKDLFIAGDIFKDVGFERGLLLESKLIFGPLTITFMKASLTATHNQSNKSLPYRFPTWVMNRTIAEFSHRVSGSRNKCLRRTSSNKLRVES